VRAPIGSTLPVSSQPFDGSEYPLATIVSVVSPVPADEVLSRLVPTERRWVEEFRDAVRARWGERVRDMRIYGSKVRGDDHDESDIDVLVLVQDNDQATSMAIWELASSISLWLSPMVMDFERYHLPISRASGFYEEMRRESVRL
jgi:predicted nucleotidyltransferase